MSYRILRCKQGSCRAAIFWELTDRGWKVALNDRPISLQEAFDQPDDVWYVAGGRALRWTPPIAAAVGLDETLYRAHKATCTAPREPAAVPEISPVPQRLVEPSEPDPQLRMPVLPRRFTRRTGDAGSTNNTHERGNHVHHRHTEAVG